MRALYGLWWGQLYFMETHCPLNPKHSTIYGGIVRSLMTLCFITSTMALLLGHLGFNLN